MSTSDRLKMLMSLHNMSRKDLAEKLGISIPTLRTRLEDGNWKYFEVVSLIDILNIEKPQDVFFQPAKGVA